MIRVPIEATHVRDLFAGLPVVGWSLDRDRAQMRAVLTFEYVDRKGQGRRAKVQIDDVRSMLDPDVGQALRTMVCDIVEGRAKLDDEIRL